MVRTFICAAVALVLFAGAGFCADKAKKGAGVAGVVKKVDAATGTITVTVKNKKETADKEFKIGDAVKFVINVGKDKKEVTGKDGLKAEQLKEGAAVTITTDAAGQVTGLEVGTPAKKKKENK